MELPENLLVFMLACTLLMAFLLIAIAVNLVALYRKSRLLTASRLELKQHRIEALLTQQEIKDITTRLAVQSTERERISRELYDRLGNVLLTIKQQFGRIEGELDQPKQTYDDAYFQLNKLLDEATYEVKRISHDLYEGSSARFDYMKALGQLIKVIMLANPILIYFQENEVEPKLYRPFKESLYRITQDLLLHTLKHNQATEVQIYFDYRAPFFVFDYVDNGQAVEGSKKLVLENMLRQAKEMNAIVTLEKVPNGGMHCRIEIETSLYGNN